MAEFHVDETPLFVISLGDPFGGACFEIVGTVLNAGGLM
jgi:hypothetical protein